MEYIYRDRLIESLTAVPLTPEQIALVLPMAERNLSFMVATRVESKSRYWDFAEKVAQTAALLGIDRKTYIEKAVMKQPALFYLAPETINNNIEQAAQRLGLSKTIYIEKAALKTPQLFYLSPERISARMQRGAELLGIDVRAYINAALKQPALFHQSPKTINDNIEGVCQHLGIDKNIYIEKAALKSPQLFCMSPEKIDANITGAAALLGIDKAAYLGAAMKRPVLFYQSPVKINANIEEGARLLGLDKEIYVRAALKQQQLFYQSPTTIKRNFDYAAAAAANGYIKTKDLLTDCVANPVSFCLAPANTHLRSIHAQITGSTFGVATFFSGKGRSKEALERTVVSHFHEQFRENGTGLRAVQVMAEAKIISGLPDWADAPAAPLRQRTRAPQ